MSAEAGRFRWPPRRRPAEGCAVGSMAAGAPGSAVPLGSCEESGPERGVRRWWREVEAAWFDPVSLPLSRRPEQEPSCWRCGGTVGPHEAGADGCSGCAGLRLPWGRLVRLGAYREPWSAWVAEVKFGRNRRLGRDLGVLLGEAVGRALAATAVEAGGGARPVVVVPVPTTFRRRLGRGIDHAGVLARGVALGIRSAEGGRGGVRVRRLLRRSHRPSQRSVAASRRSSNVSGSVRARRAGRVGRGGWGAVSSGSVLVLVDDVTTSGSTLRASSRALLGGAKNARIQGVTVWVAVVSRARSRG